jgi:uncharacterized RDD family membrane protein YckC
MMAEGVRRIGAQRGALVSTAGPPFTVLLSWLALGLGWLWILVDPGRRAWHDRLSRTRVVLVGKRPGRR